MSLKDIIVSASIAIGSVASRERDRNTEGLDKDGRPKALDERARGRMKSIVQEGTVKIAVSQAAHRGAKELAKRLNQEALKKVFGVLAKRPALAAGSALVAIDICRDGYRLIRSEIDSKEFAERIGGNVVAAAGSGAGAYIGAFAGTFAMPVVGTFVGTVAGSIIGGIGGDTYGRQKVRHFTKKEGDPNWESHDHED